MKVGKDGILHTFSLFTHFFVEISQQVHLMIFVVIQNLIYVVTNAYCYYCIEPKKEGERNE
jgi:hypothetical protein